MIFKDLAKLIANSPFFTPAHRLWKLNSENWDMPLSRFQKGLVGLYIILNDYAGGLFPPRFINRYDTHNAEIMRRFALAGMSSVKVSDGEMRKPFWNAKAIQSYLQSLIDLVNIFERINVFPPKKLLELGCGTGWMAEMLSLLRYRVVGTSISPNDINDARLRVKSLISKKITPRPIFRATPMETVSKVVRDQAPFDTVFVFEALHHAYDWQRTIKESFKCLRPGGWLVIANEPNVLHTYISYRIAKLSNTHEVGFGRNELISCLRKTGFQEVQTVKNRISFWVKPHWIIGRKPA